MLKEIVDEIGALWAFWSTITFIISFIVFWGSLAPPTPDTATGYSVQLVAFVIADVAISAVIGALISLVTKPIMELLERIGLW